MKQIKKRKNKKGFTLIELLVVLVIIGVIISLILPNTLASIRTSHEKECASNLRAIDTAIQMCYTSTRDWSACNTAVQLTAVPSVGFPYLTTFPTCPIKTNAYTFLGGGDAVTPATPNPVNHFANWPLQIGDQHL